MSADPLADDVAIAQSMISGSPCAAGVAVLWQAGLTSRRGDGSIQDDIANATGMRIADQGTLTEDDDVWTLERCEITIDPDKWAALSRCEQRRIVIHEVKHLAFHRHAEGGIMSPISDVRDLVAVPGCPSPQPPSLRQRVVARVLEMTPLGTTVWCGALRGRVMHCWSERPGARRRRFRARMWDDAATGFTVVRMRTPRRSRR